MILGVKTIHQRSVWEEPGFPVAGPKNPGVWDDFVGHYPGAGDVPDHDYRGHVYVDPTRFHGDLLGYVRAMQRAYLRDRNYSLGYNLLIDYLGGLTIGRGFDIQNAANAGSLMPGNWNHSSLSAQFITDLTRPATDQALYTFAMVTAHLRHHGHRAAVKRHVDGERTACPGAVGAQLLTGMGEPDYWVLRGPPPGSAPLPWYLTGNEEEEDDMNFPIRAIYRPIPSLVQSGRNKTFGLLADGSVRHLAGPDEAGAVNAGSPVLPIEGYEHYGQLDALDKVWRSR